MADPVFVHLRMHSEFSIGDGIARIGDAVARAVEERMPALALTDLANLFGAIKFYTAARGAGIKPITGCDLWIGNPAKPESPHRLLLLAITQGICACATSSRAPTATTSSAAAPKCARNGSPSRAAPRA